MPATNRSTLDYASRTPETPPNAPAVHDGPPLDIERPRFAANAESADEPLPKSKGPHGGGIKG